MRRTGWRMPASTSCCAMQRICISTLPAKKIRLSPVITGRASLACALRSNLSRSICSRTPNGPAWARPYAKKVSRIGLRLTPSGADHILGIQGQLWGENLRSRQSLEYMGFPRIIALAERAWASSPDWAEICGPACAKVGTAARLESICKSTRPARITATRLSFRRRTVSTATARGRRARRTCVGQCCISWSYHPLHD